MIFGKPLIADLGNKALGKRVHVFGSGPSAEQTQILVLEEDLCIACNHAIKWRTSWDVVFVETVDNSSYGQEQISLLNQVNYGLLICKNNYPYRPLSSILKMRVLSNFDRLAVLPEYQASPNEILRDLEKIIEEAEFTFPQYASSILTMVLFAVRSGAREIWLHGVDSLSQTVNELETNNFHASESFAVPFSLIFDRVRQLLSTTLRVSIKIAREVE